MVWNKIVWFDLKIVWFGAKLYGFKSWILWFGPVQVWDSILPPGDSIFGDPWSPRDSKMPDPKSNPDLILEVWRYIWPGVLPFSLLYIDGIVQDCSNSSALAMEILQSCTKPLISCTGSTCILIMKLDCSVPRSWCTCIGKKSSS